MSKFCCTFFSNIVLFKFCLFILPKCGNSGWSSSVGNADGKVVGKKVGNVYVGNFDGEVVGLVVVPHHKNL